MSSMRRLVLLRCADTENSEGTWSSWAQDELSTKGKEQAERAGRLLTEAGFHFDVLLTSVQKQAIKTAWIALMQGNDVSVNHIRSYRLNDRHCGALAGLSEEEIEKTHGKEKLDHWRLAAPPPLDTSDPRHPSNDPLCRGIPPPSLPGSESMEMVMRRVGPFASDTIGPFAISGKSVLVVGHEGSLKAVCALLEDWHIEEVITEQIPPGVPIVFEVDEGPKLVHRYEMTEGSIKAAKYCSEMHKHVPLDPPAADATSEQPTTDADPDAHNEGGAGISGDSLPPELAVTSKLSYAPVPDSVSDPDLAPELDDLDGGPPDPGLPLIVPVAGRRATTLVQPAKPQTPKKVYAFEVSVVKARGLNDGDWFTFAAPWNSEVSILEPKSDPYVICQVVAEPPEVHKFWARKAGAKDKFQTAALSTLGRESVRWDHTEQLEVNYGDSLKFTVMDKDPLKPDDLLGECHLRFDQLIQDATWRVKLVNRKGKAMSGKRGKGAFLTVKAKEVE